MNRPSIKNFLIFRTKSNFKMIWHFRRKRILVGLLTVLMAFFPLKWLHVPKKEEEGSFQARVKFHNQNRSRIPLLSLDLSSKSGIADITVKACKSPSKPDKNTKFWVLTLTVSARIQLSVFHVWRETIYF